MVFMKHCDPNHLPVHKDGTLSQDKSRVKFEASRAQCMYYSTASITAPSYNNDYKFSIPKFAKGNNSKI